MFQTGVSGARYRVRWATGAADLDAAMDLRRAMFRPDTAGGDDRDAFDALCDHLIVEDAAGDVMATCRIRVWPDGSAIGASYAAQFYDLNALGMYPAPIMEIGRFCIRPGLYDPDVLRLVWAELTREVDAQGVALLFGCTSLPFKGMSDALAALAALAMRHPAPQQWQPRVKSPDAVRLGGPSAEAARAPDIPVPAVLRSYLGMGGWISDHAVIDRDLATVHVFTALEVSRIPAARARLLRAAAALG